MAMELIETIEVGAGGAASIEFTSIPQTGVDLLLILSARSSVTPYSADNVICKVNSTTTGYSARWLLGSGSSVQSSSTTAWAGFDLGYMTTAAQTASTFSSHQLYISNYTSAAAKSASVDSVTENNATVAYQWLVANSLSSTAAITSLTLTSLNAANFVQYSTASLYKIY